MKYWWFLGTIVMNSDKARFNTFASVECMLDSCLLGVKLCILKFLCDPSRIQTTNDVYKNKINRISKICMSANFVQVLIEIIFLLWGSQCGSNRDGVSRNMSSIAKWQKVAKVVKQDSWVSWMEQQLLSIFH